MDREESAAMAAAIVGVEILLTHIFNRLHEKALVDRTETIASLIGLCRFAAADASQDV